MSKKPGKDDVNAVVLLVLRQRGVFVHRHFRLYFQHHRVTRDRQRHVAAVEPHPTTRRAGVATPVRCVAPLSCARSPTKHCPHTGSASAPSCQYAIYPRAMPSRPELLIGVRRQMVVVAVDLGPIAAVTGGAVAVGGPSPCRQSSAAAYFL